MNSLRHVLFIVVLGVLSTVTLVQGQSSTLGNLTWSGDRRYLSWVVDQQIQIIDAQSNDILNTLMQPAPITAVAWSSDGRIAVGTYDSTVRVYKFLESQPELTLYGDQPMVYSLAWSLDNHYLAGIMSEIDHPSPMYLWDSTNGDLVTSQTNGQLVNLAFSPDGSRIAGWLAYVSKVVDTLTLDQKTRYNADIAFFPNTYTFAWSPDGKILAAGTESGQVKLWDATQSGNQPLLTFTVGEFVRSVAYAPDGKGILVATSGGKVQLWDIATQQMIIEELLEPNLSAVWSPYTGRLAYVTEKARELGELPIKISVPLASTERLQSIAAGCYPEMVSPVISANLTNLIMQVEALPANAIPAACAADLIAVAEAIIAQS